MLKSKIYSVIYTNGTDIKKFNCSYYSLQKTVDKFIKDNGNALCIVAHKSNPVKNKQTNQNKVQIQKYYNNKYSSYYKKFKKGKISENTFLEIKQKLKQLKQESKTIEEFKNNFSEYIDKKNTNNIPPYNVSD